MKKIEFEKTHNPEVDPVEWKDFFQVMNEMNEVFPGISSQVRIKLYFNTVKDLPMKAIRDIAISFISSQRQMPLPSDFRNAAKEWLRAKKTYVHDETPVPIECKYCGDIGINYITRNDDGAFYSLMRCDCKTHITQDLKAPTWSRHLSAAYARQSCLLEWFKPKTTESFDLQNLELTHLISKFKTHKSNAEKFWSDMGYENNGANV